MTTAAEFFALAPLATRSVPHGTGQARVRELTLPERQEFLEVAREGRKNAALCFLVRTAVIDDDGVPILVGQPDEVLIRTISPEPLAKLGAEVLRLSGMVVGDKPEDDAGKT